MKKKYILIALIDHEGITENLIISSLKQLKNSKNKFILIGDINFYKEIKKKIFVTNILNKKNLNKKILFYNICSKNLSNLKFICNITDICIKLLKQKIAKCLINMPINKKKYFKSRFNGYTEFFANRLGEENKETMLLYNDKISISPITTHEKIKNISKLLTKEKIIKNVTNIKKFYNKIIKKNIIINILGLNPHAGIDFNKNTEEKKTIIPAIKKIKKKFKKIFGPISADTAFINLKRNTCYVGMYHDQVLPVFKTLFGFDGINITIGLKYIRLSPDHGTGKNLIKNKNIRINNKSFLSCISFCDKYLK